MSKGLTITGGVLIGLGVLSGILAVVLSVVPFMLMEDEVVLTDEDFQKGEEGYIAYIDDSELGSRSYVSIDSRTEDVITVKLTVTDPLSSTAFEDTMSTPIEQSVDTSTVGEGLYTFRIIIQDGFHNLQDLEVEIRSDAISEESMFSCCGAMLLYSLSGLLIIVGIALIIIHFVMKSKKEKRERQRRASQYQEPPKYSGGAPFDSGYNQWDPSQPPGSLDPPPGPPDR